MIIDLVCIATDYYLELIQLLHLGVMGQIFTHANLQWEVYLLLSSPFFIF